MRKFCLLWLCVEKLLLMSSSSMHSQKFTGKAQICINTPTGPFCAWKHHHSCGKAIFFTAKGTLISGNLFSSWGVFTTTGAPRLYSFVGVAYKPNKRQSWVCQPSVVNAYGEKHSYFRDIFLSHCPRTKAIGTW